MDGDGMLHGLLLYGSDMNARDLAIRRTALRIGYGAVMTVYMSGLLGVFGWLRYRGWKTVTIDIGLLPVAALLPVILLLIVISITSIILYRRNVLSG